jgi:hypothetical protein
MALPSPREPPVTTATCPERDSVIASEHISTPLMFLLLFCLFKDYTFLKGITRRLLFLNQWRFYQVAYV